MAWPKIKNIIILILLGLNLCLAGFSVGRVVQVEQMQLRARENAISFLEKRDIQLFQENVPLEMGLYPQKVSRQTEREAELAAALLEEPVEREARGAEVYRYYNDRGSVQFHSGGEFSAYFAPDTLRAGGQDLESFCLDILARLDIQGELVEHRRTEGGQSLTFRQIWQGTPLFNCQTTLNFQGDELNSITSARRLMGQPVEDLEQRTITVATALMKFYSGISDLGDACSQVTAVTQGYAVSTGISGAMSLTPVWSIQTDVRTYQLNTVTGTLNRQS